MKIYLEHGEAYGNIGDEAMLLNAMRRLNNCFKDCEFIIPVSENEPLPEEIYKYNVRLIKHPKDILKKIFGRLIKYPIFWKNLVKFADFILKRKYLNFFYKDLFSWNEEIKNTDIFYVVGAANLTHFCLGACVIYKCWVINVAKKHVKQVVISSQGIGPIDVPWARKLIKETFSNINIISYRDYKNSNIIINEIQPKNINTKITCDEAYSLEIPDESTINNELLRIGLNKDDNFIALHFRETDYTKNTRYLAPKIANFIENINRDFNYKFLFIPMSYARHSKDDNEYGLHIQSFLEQKNSFYILDNQKNAQIIKGIVGKSKFALGLSYHIHIFALSQSKPAIILYTGEYYKYKSEGLAEFFNYPVSSHNLDIINYQDIKPPIMNINDNYDNIVHQITQVNKNIMSMNDWHIIEAQKGVK